MQKSESIFLKSLKDAVVLMVKYSGEKSNDLDKSITLK